MAKVRIPRSRRARNPGANMGIRRWTAMGPRMSARGTLSRLRIPNRFGWEVRLLAPPVDTQYARPAEVQAKLARKRALYTRHYGLYMTQRFVQPPMFPTTRAEADACPDRREWDINGKLVYGRPPQPGDPDYH